MSDALVATRRTEVKVSEGRTETRMDENYLKRIVFIVQLSWTRVAGETETPEDTYGRMVRRLPAGTGLYVGCSPGGRNYDAVVVLRGRLATLEELIEWLDVGRDWRAVEPQAERTFEEFVVSTQSYCERENRESHGLRIEVERGDAETWRMMKGLRDRKPHGYRLSTRYGGNVQRLTDRMRGYQGCESEGTGVCEAYGELGLVQS